MINAKLQYVLYISFTLLRSYQLFLNALSFVLQTLTYTIMSQGNKKTFNDRSKRHSFFDRDQPMVILTIINQYNCVHSCDHQQSIILPGTS